MEKKQIITLRECIVLTYLRGKDYTSPTEVGRHYGIVALGRKSCHSSTGSPILKALVSKGLVERNERGWYRLKINNHE